MLDLSHLLHYLFLPHVCLFALQNLTFRKLQNAYFNEINAKRQNFFKRFSFCLFRHRLSWFSSLFKRLIKWFQSFKLHYMLIYQFSRLITIKINP